MSKRDYYFKIDLLLKDEANDAVEDMRWGHLAWMDPCRNEDHGLFKDWGPLVLGQSLILKSGHHVSTRDC